jgi:hypothetical protein
MSCWCMKPMLRVPKKPIALGPFCWIANSSCCTQQGGHWLVRSSVCVGNVTYREKIQIGDRLF